MDSKEFLDYQIIKKLKIIKLSLSVKKLFIY